jgi:hypothetical protein
VPRAEAVAQAADAEQLRALFRQDHAALHVRLTGPGPYALGPGDGDDEAAGLTFRGRQLVLESDPARPPAVIRLTAGATADGRPAAALIVTGPADEGAVVTLRGLRFECAAATGADAPVAAVVATGLAKLEIDRCAFVLPPPAGTPPAGAAVTVSGRDGGDSPDVRLTDCLFVRGPRAVQLAGRARVRALHCAFGPHAALFALRDTGGAEDTLVRLEHCAALLEGGAVVLAGDGAGGSVLAGHCLFSHPAPADPAPAGAVLVRQTGDRAGELTYQGLLGPDGAPQRNGYHNLAAFWADETPTAGPRQAATLEDARRLAPAFRDDDALELPLTPWADPRPLARLADAARPDAPPDAARDAFAVNLRLARLRPPRAAAGELLGVLHNVWGPSYPEAPPSAAEPVVRTKVVDPAAGQTDPARGVYPSLAHAVLDARPDDTILIKKNGPLEIEPVRLDQPNLRLTVKAFPHYRPVLALAAAPDADPALFRLYDGELRLEGLEFALRPVRAEFKTQAVVALAGAGLCTFQRCAITLEETEEVQLAAVLVPDADGVVRSGTDRKAVARARFEECFVRGKGDLLSAKAGRRFDLSLDSTLVALDGTLAVVAGGTKEPPPGPPCQLRLRHVTAALTEHVLALKAYRDDDRHGPGLAPVQVTADESLLVAASGRAVVHLDGIDADEQVRQLVTWAGAKTLYGNTGPALLDVQPTSPDRMPLPMPYDAERWLAFTREAEAEAPFVRVRFAQPPAADRPWAKSRPADFHFRQVESARPPDAVAVCGAPLDRLPVPVGE